LRIFVPRYDATAVYRLKGLGRSSWEKTATTEFAYQDPAPTRNPGIWATPRRIEQRFGSRRCGSDVPCYPSGSRQGIGSATRVLLRYCGLKAHIRPDQQVLDFSLDRKLGSCRGSDQNRQRCCDPPWVMAEKDLKDPTSSSRPLSNYSRTENFSKKRPRMGLIHSFSWKRPKNTHG